MKGNVKASQRQGFAEMATAREQSKTPSKAGQRDLLDQVWHFFTLPKVAMVLILLLAGASMVGALIMQAPESVVGEPGAYQDWLGKARMKYGPWTELLSTLGLLSIFTSFWFKALVAVLIINILVCTFNRWKSVWHPIRHPRVRMASNFYQRSGSTTLTAVGNFTPIELAIPFASLLKGRHYRVKLEGEGGKIHVYADKNWYGPLGTFLSHLGIVLMLAGALSSNLLGGFRESGFVVPVDSTKAVGMGTDLSLYVESFADEYHLDGRPKDYRTDAVLFQEGREVKRQTIRVNEPMEYQGVRFHQSFYGQAVSVRVQDDKGKDLFADNVALAYQSNDGTRPVGNITLSAKNLLVYFVGNGGPGDPLVAPGELFIEAYQGGANRPAYRQLIRQKQPTEVGGLIFTFERELQFTGLQVVYDPTGYVVWAACALMVLGMVMVLYFPHRRLWALCQREEERSTLTMLSLDNKDRSFAQELKDLIDSLRVTSLYEEPSSNGHTSKKERRGRGNEILAGSLN